MEESNSNPLTLSKHYEPNINRYHKKELTAKYDALFDMHTFVGDASDALWVHLFDNL